MSLNVLVVDDDPDVRAFSVAVVEEQGYLPSEATNGEEALTMIQRQRPALVILDVLMPRQSGIRLYRALKTDPALATIPVVVLSGIAEQTFLRSQQALSEGDGVRVPPPEFYLEKPVEADELAATIRKALAA